MPDAAVIPADDLPRRGKSMIPIDLPRPRLLPAELAPATELRDICARLLSDLRDEVRVFELPVYPGSNPQEETTMARLPHITSKDQVAAKDHATFDSIVASRGAVQGPFLMFMHSPEVAERVAHLGAYVRFEGTLDMRVRVLAAMTVAREFQAMYVWGAQTGGARRQGVPEETITAIREGHSRGIAQADADIVEFTRQLLRQHRVDDALFKKLHMRFGNDDLVQLTTAIGYYTLLGMTVNACELEPADDAEVLDLSTLP
jgi:4-carboxymuconolactone decarboxylase